MRMFAAIALICLFDASGFSQAVTGKRGRPSGSVAAAIAIVASTLNYPADLLRDDAGDAPRPCASTSTGIAAGSSPWADSADLFVRHYRVDSLKAGYPARFEVHFGNKGNRSANNVKLYFIKNSRSSFSGTSLPHTTVSGDTAVWNIGTLGANQSDTIYLQLRLPDTTGIIGKTIESKANIYPYSGDADTANNRSYELNRVEGPAKYIQRLSLIIRPENRPQPGATAGYRLVYGFSTQLDSVKGRIAFVKDPALTFLS